MTGYVFTNTWFDGVVRKNWDVLIPALMPKRMLEIGSYEGASTCYLIDELAARSDIEIHCIDTWEGGFEQKASVDPSESRDRCLYEPLSPQSVNNGDRQLSVLPVVRPKNCELMPYVC